MLGSHLRESCHVWEQGGASLLAENEGRERRGQDLGMLLCQGAALFLSRVDLLHLSLEAFMEKKRA